MAIVLTNQLSPGILTGFEFAAMGRYPYTGLFGKLTDGDREKTWEALKIVDAESLADRYFDQLSDGERQKLLLARALTQEPELILLDEPTQHLDLRHRLEVMSLLRKFCREKAITIIASLHDVDVAAKVSDIVAFVKDGSVQSWGEPENILSSDAVSTLYDLHFASYNKMLGSLEMRNENEGQRVFVVAGCGTGSSLFRLLSKHAISISTGILHENDIDCHVASAIGAETVAETSMEYITSEKRYSALTRLKNIERIIDSGFPVNEQNKANLDLIHFALMNNKRIYTLRDKQQSTELFGSSSVKMVYCRDEIDLIHQINSDISWTEVHIDGTAQCRDH